MEVAAVAGDAAEHELPAGGRAGGRVEAVARGPTAGLRPPLARRRDARPLQPNYVTMTRDHVESRYVVTYLRTSHDT